MRDLTTENDLISLVNERVEESIHLDFKESKALGRSERQKRELAKDVAAMATAEGGLLVYGIIEDRNFHTAKYLDDGCDPTDISKETIEQVIDSRVSPRIAGLRIVPIELKTRSPGKLAFSISVPASECAPHMADHCYYTRMNFQSVPMEDYQVRDVMFRRRVPRLEITYRVDVVANRGCMLRFGAANAGLVGAEDLYFELEFVPDRVCWHDKPPSAFEPVVHVVPPEGARTAWLMTYHQVSGAPPGHGTSGYRTLPPVLYPDVNVPFQELVLHVKPDAVAGEQIQARLFARDMPVVKKAIHVSQFLAGLRLHSAAVHLADSIQWLPGSALIDQARELLRPIHREVPEIVQAWVALEQIPPLYGPSTPDFASIRSKAKALVELAARYLLPSGTHGVTPINSSRVGTSSAP